MLKDDLKAARDIAAKVRAAGGRAFYVGGFVRDGLLGRENTDIDIEIHGLYPNKLENILSGFGSLVKTGAFFGIYSIKGLGLDISLPRRERVVGAGHRDFEIYCDPFIGEKKAAERRDFTVNALMRDILTGEILDFFGGRRDLESGFLRHVSCESFAEDPLRVLRLARLAACLGFRAAEETLRLCRGADLSPLSRERVFDETKNALLHSGKPSVFFRVLRRASALGVWFPELEATIDTPQNPVFHPEGDVWEHTMAVTDAAAGMRDEADFPAGFMFAALCHDFGKPLCTHCSRESRRPVSGGNEGVKITSCLHEKIGLKAAGRFLDALTDDKKLKSYVLNCTLLHMRPNALAAQGSGIRATNRLFDEALFPADLIRLSQCDGAGRYPEYARWLFERLKLYNSIMSEPFVDGKDLIAAGIAPGEAFSELLSFARSLRLAGVDKKNALGQVLARAGELRGGKKPQNPPEPEKKQNRKNAETAEADGAGQADGAEKPRTS